VDDQEGAVQGAQDDVVDQTAALEEGALAMNATGVVLVALAYVDDAALCCASELWFDPGELPFEVFYCCHPGSVFCNVSVCGWLPRGPKSSPLQID
jgi:hypothetical protein